MTSAEARCNKSLRPRKPEGSLGQTAQDVHLDSHTAAELWNVFQMMMMIAFIQRSRADSLRSHVIVHKWLDFYSAFLKSTKVVCLQRWHGWCHMELLPSRRTFCVHHTTMHHVTSCKATYVRCMRVSCNLPPALLAEWPGSFTCHCGNTGVERTPK